MDSFARQRWSLKCLGRAPMRPCLGRLPPNLEAVWQRLFSALNGPCSPADGLCQLVPPMVPCRCGSVAGSLGAPGSEQGSVSRGLLPGVVSLVHRHGISEYPCLHLSHLNKWGSSVRLSRKVLVGRTDARCAWSQCTSSHRAFFPCFPHPVCWDLSPSLYLCWCLFILFYFISFVPFFPGPHVFPLNHRKWGDLGLSQSIIINSLTAIWKHSLRYLLADSESLWMLWM